MTHNQPRYLGANVILKPFLLSCLLLQVNLPALLAQSDNPVDMLMYHNDHAGTGQNLDETRLTRSNVHSNSFGLLFSRPVDGFVFAQPLYLSGVEIPGKGTHDVVYVATEHDTLYAFDAHSNQGSNALPLWTASFINTVTGLTTIPSSVFGFSDPPEFGVTGTPVIDRVSRTLYVVAKSRDNRFSPPQYHSRLYALDVATGEPKFGSPVEIQGFAPGTGVGNDGKGLIPFVPLWYAQRCSLLLADGVLYIAFGAHNDEGPYHGCIIGYNAQTLDQLRYFITTPSGAQGGIWMSGAAPTVDDEGNIYCITGNGTFTANLGTANYGNTFLKLKPQRSHFLVQDYFTPYDQANLSARDLDVGAAGPLLLPESVGSPEHPRLVVSCGKGGTMYLLDRENMGHYNSTNNNQIVQSISVPSPRNSLGFFNDRVYYSGIGAPMAAYSIADAHLSTAPVFQTAYRFTYGSTPSISANGTNNAIVWAIEWDASGNRTGPAILRAYDANNLTNQLYTSEDAGPRDRIPVTREFHLPVVVNGKVYVATQTGLAVFGLFPPVRPRLAISADLDVTIQGVVGKSYVIEHSTDMVNWEGLGMITLTSAVQSLGSIIQIQPDQTIGFFRAMLAEQ